MVKGVMMTVGILAFLVLIVMAFRMRSGYADISTDQGENVKTIFDSRESLKCVPGPDPDASYYTGESSGGFCGAQQQVDYHGHRYNITGGIGGSLLSR